MLEELGYATTSLLPGPGYKDAQTVRREVEASGLLENLSRCCREINKVSQGVLIYEQPYLKPSRVICTYSLEMEQADYLMTLLAERGEPTLVFSAQSSRKKSGNNYRSYGLSYFYGYFSRFGNGRGSRYKLKIQPEGVSEEDLQVWFAYLLSRFQEKFQPVTSKP